MFPHGLMFHHFCDRAHPRGQGAIDAGEFRAILRHVGTDRILPAAEWHARAAAGTLNDDQLCLTFDDNLLCQYDVAVPVLEDLGLTAFWFIYTSPLDGGRDQLELYRYFRTVYFADVDAFYDAFFAAVSASPYAARYSDQIRRFDPRAYLSEFSFYSDSDRKFRFVRDRVLSSSEYADIMDAMVAQAGMDIETAAARLWMDEGRLRGLVRAGHVLGLHSHTHPTVLAGLSADEQAKEYGVNAAWIERISGARPTVASHPCNSYSPATLSILRDMGIDVAFRSNMAAGRAANALEMPREDHANLLRQCRLRDESVASS